MGAARTIQATKAETVMDMYEHRGVPCFAIWQGNDMNYPVFATSMQEGAEELERILGWIEESESAAIYTLKVYMGVSCEEEIDNKRKHNGQFNFRLSDKSLAIGGREGNAGYFYQFTDKLEKMGKQVEDLSKRLDEKEDDEGQIGGIWGALLNPEFIGQLPALIGTIKGLLSGPAPPMEVPPADQLGATLTQEQKIQNALTILRAHVPDLGDVLSKLAGLAENKPVVFKTYLSMIRTMKG